jgi:hypothetical protein
MIVQMADITSNMGSEEHSRSATTSNMAVITFATHAIISIKHDNHVTLLATIYSRANTIHVLFSQHVSVAMRHHQVKPNTIHQITNRY